MESDVYIRELKLYPKSDILKVLGNDKEIFDKLRINNIIKKNKGLYNFHFVGVIVVDKQVLHIYPKYIPDKNNIKKDFNQILKVIKKYNKSHKDFDYQEEDIEDISLYILSLMIFFIEDYYENGVYHNIKNIIETNGNGEINWDRTINDTLPIIKNNIPFYTELQTNHKIDNQFNYFKLLHEYIITESSKFLEKSGLLDEFGFYPLNLSDRELEDFGSKEFILNKLKMELNVEFNTHKQGLLKAMHDFISRMSSFSNDEILTVYGTTDYEYIWEEMCSKVFDNKLDTELADLNLGFENKNSLRDLIKKSKWVFDTFSVKKSKLIPDVISIDNEKNLFMICDAKYYELDIDYKKKTVDGEPHLSSITKQYLYELAYKEFINVFRFNVVNAFVFPKYCGVPENKGHIELNFFSKLGLEDIQVIMIPACEVNELYLNDEKMDISRLNV